MSLLVWLVYTTPKGPPSPQEKLVTGQQTDDEIKGQTHAEL